MIPFAVGLTKLTEAGGDVAISATVGADGAADLDVRGALRDGCTILVAALAPCSANCSLPQELFATISQLSKNGGRV